MKLNKASGIDGIEVEHLMYAHPIVCTLLCNLFNCMLQCGRVPYDFHFGVIVPLVKDQCGDVSDVNNYRGITLSPTISKLFEMCLIENFGHLLTTSDLQFGFKKSLGCANAIFTVNSVVDYFTKHGSTVNVCALDMSKAFDKVNHFGMYLKLMKRNIPPAFLDVLIDWYSKCCAFVRWNGAFSRCIALTCGVRQGGVLSPLLFTIYVNDVIIKLRNSNHGCFINNMFVGCIMYADDLLLIAASVSSLQSMINICAEEIASLDMRFNVVKSSVVRIGKKFKHHCSPLSICSDPLEFVNVVKYLGVYIVSGSHFMVDIKKHKAKFFTALNGILSKCKGCMNEMVSMHLINTYCRPLLLYACECITLCKSDIDSLSHSWNSIYWKLFHVNDPNCIRDIQFFMDDISIENDVAMRRQRFTARIARSTNTVMIMLYNFLK
jgi:hypothetical protein